VGGARFTGYGLLALPLESGDVFAFRSVSQSSLGLPFKCLWHRDPQGRWTTYCDVAPSRSLAPYIAPGLGEVRVTDIELRHRGRRELAIEICAARLQVAVRLAANPLARALGAATAVIPESFWRLPGTLDALGHAVGLAVGSGPLRLHGSSPDGSSYRIRPAALWQVAAAVAVLDGRDLGPVVPLSGDASLGGYRLPRRALLAAVTEEFTPPLARLAA